MTTVTFSVTEPACIAPSFAVYGFALNLLAPPVPFPGVVNCAAQGCLLNIDPFLTLVSPVSTLPLTVAIPPIPLNVHVYVQALLIGNGWQLSNVLDIT